MWPRGCSKLKHGDMAEWLKRRSAKAYVQVRFLLSPPTLMLRVVVWMQLI